MRRLLTWLVPLVSLAVAPARLAAQSNDEINTGIQFDFSTPGARGLALGGAFLGLVDDATAAYANPAGLSNLTRPDFSVEGRLWSNSSRFTRRGHSPEDGTTGVGVDTVRGLEPGGVEDRTAGFSFLSYVYPRDRWAVAFYRHELANFAARIESEGPFIGEEGPIRIFPAKSEMDLRIVNSGASGSVKLGQKFSLGAGIAWSDFSLSSRTRRFYRGDERLPADQPANLAPGGFFGPADFSAANVFNTQTQEGEDGDLAWQAGFLWQAGETWSLGGVYRRGPEFSYRAEFIYGPKSEAIGEARNGERATRNGAGVAIGGEGRFHVPDSFGLGIALRPDYRLQIALDVQRVLYSQMTDRLVNLLQVVTADQVRKFKMDDAVEVRIGIEYLVFREHPVALRLGAWNDPDHKMRFASSDPRELLLTARFGAGKDEIHLSGGVGLYLGAEKKYKLDAALDLSDRTDTASLAIATKF